MAFVPTAVRLWKRLTAEERQAAADAFWAEPAQEAIAGALGAIIKARRLRPQVARSLPAEARARMLANIMDPGEPAAAALLVSLHLSQRRALLKCFLDALGLAHEDGVLKDDEEAASAPAPLTEAQLEQGLTALRGAHDAHQIEVYLNTLWLQDPERWAGLEALAGR